MVQRWRGAAPPERGPGPVYDVVWPTVGRPIEGTLLADAFVGVPIHWRGERGQQTRRSVFCPGPAHCGEDMHKKPLDWRGYMPIYWESRGRVALLVVGLDVFRTLSLIIPADTPLRGSRFIFHRSGTSNFGPIDVTTSALAPHAWRGRAPDIGPTLAALYGPSVLAVLGDDLGDDQQQTPAPTPSPETPPAAILNFREMRERKAQS